jgi:hypothetical protein
MRDMGYSSDLDSADFLGAGGGSAGFGAGGGAGDGGGRLPAFLSLSEAAVTGDFLL